MMPAKVVVLNGVGSAGKSTVAKALQQIAEEPFLHVEMDAFLAMLPETYQDHPDGLVFEPLTEEGVAAMAVRTGAVAERALKGMRHAVAALAGAGNNLIVDEVLFGDAATQHGNAVADYRALLAPYRVWFVGVFAPLDVLEARERRRGDRHLGLARWQFDRVHHGMTYDLEVDTAAAGPADCARIIKERFGL
ncbi:MAG: chloramphenicol phosphotransferase [Kiloniellaceae bacterium]